MYVFGEHVVLGFSPFAIDQAIPSITKSLTKVYVVIMRFVKKNTCSQGLAMAEVKGEDLGIGYVDESRIDDKYPIAYICCNNCEENC